MTSDTITDEHRKRHYIQVLTIHRALDQDHPGGYMGALITMVVGLGRIEGKPPTISATADMLNVSRATVLRKARKLQAAGLMQIENREGRTYLTSTDPSEPQWRSLDGMIHTGWVNSNG